MKVPLEITIWEVLIHTMVLILLTNLITTLNLQKINGTLAALLFFT